MALDFLIRRDTDARGSSGVVDRRRDFAFGCESVGCGGAVRPLVRPPFAKFGGVGKE